MAYTVAQLAKLSKTTVRTLHWYDKIGLLKAAYQKANGYRYYEEEQLLTLQQILFFKELGFELKKIQKILKRNDFDRIKALIAHRQMLQDKMAKTKKLIKVIDKTVAHLQGAKKMNDEEMFLGFSQETQAEYEKQLIESFGEEIRISIEESKQNMKNWSSVEKEHWQKEFDCICQELASLLQTQASTTSKEVQSLIRRHYQWLKKCWTPTKESYAKHGQFIVLGDLRKVYERYHPQLPQWMAEAMQYFAKKEL